MKIKWLTALFGILTLVSCSGPVDPKENKKEIPIDQNSKDLIYQYSIIDALLAGVYDGDMTFGELKKHGDFGIGSFNHLDGELYINDGKVFKLRYDGGIQEIPDGDSTGIAFVKFFNPDTSFVIEQKNLTYQKLQEKLSGILNRNGIYAIRIKGNFTTMRGRAPKPANKPYAPLREYLSGGGQSDFQFENTTGTCVGFFMPPYMARTNVPGYHVHYMSDDRKNGGHIFEFNTDRLMIEVDRAKGFIIEENSSAEMDTVDLARDRMKDLQKVE